MAHNQSVRWAILLVRVRGDTHERFKSKIFILWTDKHKNKVTQRGVRLFSESEKHKDPSKVWESEEGFP